MSNNNFCLILTATISPQNKNWVARNDEKLRLEDYKQSLKKWLKQQKSISTIVFAENSNYPLDELKRIVTDNNIFRKDVEFLSYSYSPQGETNISLGELDILTYVYNNSELLRDCNKVIKVTGRLFVQNIDKILSRIHNDFHFISSFSENLSYVDSSLLIFDKDFYQQRILHETIDNILNQTDIMDFERATAKALHNALADDYRWFPFPIWPIIQGVSGTKNSRYSYYSRWRSLKTTLISALYHRLFRNVYTNRSKRRHLFERWDIQPKKNKGGL